MISMTFLRQRLNLSFRMIKFLLILNSVGIKMKLQVSQNIFNLFKIKRTSLQVNIRTANQRKNDDFP